MAYETITVEQRDAVTLITLNRPKALHALTLDMCHAMSAALTDWAGDEAVQAIIEGMQWLGLEHDEGPFYQMKRMDRYREVIGQMLEQGTAYYCYCTPEEVEAMRERQRAAGGGDDVRILQQGQSGGIGKCLSDQEIAVASHPVQLHALRLYSSQCVSNQLVVGSSTVVVTGPVLEHVTQQVQLLRLYRMALQEGQKSLGGTGQGGLQMEVGNKKRNRRLRFLHELEISHGR